MRSRLVFLLIALSGCSASRTVSPGRAAAANAAVTSLATLASRLVQGEVRSSDDVALALGAGAVSGLGFYEAKSLAGRGHLGLGLALGYASASLAENVSEGEHPLGAIRYGLGPLDVRVRTPLARSPRAVAVLEVNAAALASTAVLPFLGYRPDLEAGALVFRRPRDVLEGAPDRLGFALGRVIALDTERADVVAHEAVHVVQALQIGAVTPGYRIGLEVGAVPLALQADWGLAAMGALHLVVPYEQRWTEVEAFSLVPDLEAGCGGPVCTADGR